MRSRCGAPIEVRPPWRRASPRSRRSRGLRRDAGGQVEQHRGGEALPDGVQRGRPDAVVGGDADDVDLGRRRACAARRPGRSPPRVPLEARSTPPRARPCGRPPRSGRCPAPGGTPHPAVPTTQCTGQDVDEVRRVAEVRARVDVVVLGRDHVVPAVRLGRRAARGDRRRPPPAPPATAQRAALAEVVLHVDDDQRVGSSALLPSAAGVTRSTVTGIAGSPAESLSPSHGMEIRHSRRCSATRSRVGRSATGSPPRTNGRCSGRSCGCGRRYALRRRRPPRWRCRSACAGGPRSCARRWCALCSERLTTGRPSTSTSL